MCPAGFGLASHAAACATGELGQVATAYSVWSQKEGYKDQPEPDLPEAGHPCWPADMEARNKATKVCGCDIIFL